MFFHSPVEKTSCLAYFEVHIKDNALKIYEWNENYDCENNEVIINVSNLFTFITYFSGNLTAQLLMQSIRVCFTIEKISLSFFRYYF